MKFTKAILILACSLVLSRAGLADSILVGTTLTNAMGGAGLCPSDADCLRIAQQFTLFEPVVVDEVKVIVAGPYFFQGPGASFDVSLSPGGGPIGSGFLPFDPNGDIVAQVFDFDNLDIPLGPGTYYLEVSAGNLTWPAGVPLVTSAGTIGPERLCDPTIRPCGDPGTWQSFNGPRGMEIDGTVVPEPSSWLLFGTGLLGFCSLARKKLWLN